MVLALALAVIYLAQKSSKQEPANTALPLTRSQVQERISLSYLTDIMWEIRVLEIGVKKQWTYAGFPLLNFKWPIEKYFWFDFLKLCMFSNSLIFIKCTA